MDDEKRSPDTASSDPLTTGTGLTQVSKCQLCQRIVSADTMTTDVDGVRMCAACADDDARPKAQAASSTTTITTIDAPASTASVTIAPDDTSARIEAPKVQRPKAPKTDEPKPEDYGRGPSAPAAACAKALKVALRAAPKRGEQPSVDYLVIRWDNELDRVSFSARDGTRWIVAYAPLSDSVPHGQIVCSVKSAKSLLRQLELAEKLFPGGANARWPSCGEEWAISKGDTDPIVAHLAVLESLRRTDAWKPPPFRPGVASDDRALAQYEASAIADATRWPGGGAVVARDEIDNANRRHVSLTDDHGQELVHSVIVPRGQTDGLPADAQQSLAGVATPKDSESGMGKGKRPRATPKPPKAPKPAKVARVAKPKRQPKPKLGPKPGRHKGGRGRR